MIFNLKILEKISEQLLRRKKAKKESLVTEEIKDIILTEDMKQALRAKKYIDFSNSILDNAKKFKSGLDMEDGFHYVKNDGIEGIAIDLDDTDSSSLEWQVYIQSLLVKLKALHYVKQYAAVETSKKNTDTLTEYKHYYKPSFRLNKSLPADQLYGNVSIELKYLNNKLYRLLFKVNTYSDRSYQAPKEFLELLKHLF